MSSLRVHLDSWVSNIKLAQYIISLTLLGDWSMHTYLPPTRSDSRSCCPALNALANHGTSQQLRTCKYYCMCLMSHPIGILPRDGKSISFLEMNKAVRTAYNLSPSLCLNVYTTHFSALFP